MLNKVRTILRIETYKVKRYIFTYLKLIEHTSKYSYCDYYSNAIFSSQYI